MNTVMNLRFARNARNFLTGKRPLIFLAVGWLVHYKVSCLLPDIVNRPNAVF